MRIDLNRAILHRILTEVKAISVFLNLFTIVFVIWELRTNSESMAWKLCSSQNESEEFYSGVAADS